MKRYLVFLLFAILSLGQTSPQDEKLRGLGERIRADIFKDSPLLDLPEAASLLAQLSSQLDPATPAIQFDLIRSNQIEIFVLPGNIALVPSRLLLLTKTEDELARHLAHAIAHIRLRHGIRETKSSPSANIASIPLIWVGMHDGIHRTPASNAALPSYFRAQQDRWEQEANDYAAKLLANQNSAGLTPELSRIQAQLLPLTKSSKAPSLLR